MKALFNNQKDLIEMLRRLPRPDQEVTINGEIIRASECLDECQQLVPLMFRYKEILIKSPKGVGSNKAFNRFAELAKDNSITVPMNDYQALLNQIGEEFESLVTMGIPEETAKDLASAKTKVERFKMISKSINNFRVKIQNQMIRVQGRYQEIVDELRKDKIKNNPDMKSIYSDVLNELEQKNEEVKKLVSAFDRYCDLQIKYNGIINQIVA